MNFPSYSFGLFLMSQDVQIKLRDAFKKMGDEFMTYTYATRAKVSICFFFFFFYTHIIDCIGCYTSCTSPIQYRYAVTLDVYVFFCRNTSLRISRPCLLHAESWSETSTTAFTNCGTEQREWQSAQRRTPQICSCLGRSLGKYKKKKTPTHLLHISYMLLWTVLLFTITLFKFNAVVKMIIKLLVV